MLSLALFAPLVQADSSDSLHYFKNYFVTGDYAVAGVGLRGTGVNGFANGTINLSGVPTGADIVAAFLYWQTVETSPATAPSAINGFFDNNAIVGKLLGDPMNPACWSSGGTTGPKSASGRVYRADVLRYLPIDHTNSIRLANGSHTVKLADSGGNGNGNVPLTNGASLVVIYRILTPGANVPLRSVVIYDGAYTLSRDSDAMSVNIGGFYQASDNNGAKMTQIVANGQPNFDSETVRVNGETIASNPFRGKAGIPGARWDNPTFNIPLERDDSSFSTQVTADDNVCLTWGAIVTSTNVVDTDGDGLLDVWETNGLHLNPGDATKKPPQPATFGDCDFARRVGESCVNLPAMGADPGTNSRPHKDIFVEIDWLYGSDHVHLPKLGALSAIAATFAQQSPPIYLHFDVGNNYQGTPSAPLPPGYNAPLSYIVPAQYARGGDTVNEATLVCVPSLKVPCAFPGYSVLGWKIGVRAIQDGYPALGIPAHFDHDRKDLFHYVVFAHALSLPSSVPGVPASTSGAADRPGGDLMVTLGLWPSDVAGDNQTGSVQVQAGTLMHELGHNLGLSHAGLARTPNCVPNYQSVMNYLYQARGLTDGSGFEHIDFSYGLLPSLNEGSLIGSFTSPYRIRYYGPVKSPATPAGVHCDGTKITDGATEVRGESIFLNKVDWLNNGAYAGGTEDVNFDGVPGQTLKDSNDWGNLNLRQVGARLNVGGLSSDIGATDLGATDLGATDLGATDLGATDLGATDLGATDLGATDLGDTDYLTTVSTIDPINAAQPLKAVSSLTGITLTWGAPSIGQIRHYYIYRSDPNNAATFLASVDGTPPATTFTDTVTQLTSVGPAPNPSTGTFFNTPYTYYIASVDTNGTQSSPSNTASGIVNHLFITASAQSRVYGTTTFNATAFTSAGIQDSTVTGTTTCTTTAVQQSPVVAGGYPITCGPPLGQGLSPAAGVTYYPGILTITPAPLTATITVNNRYYDGTTVAAIATCTPAVVLFSDLVTCGGTAAFDGPHAGPHTVLANLTLGGSAATNYYLTPPATATTTASILPAPQSIIYSAIAAQNLGAADFQLNWTATSGLGITFGTSTSIPCSVSPTGLVHLIAAGSCTISASQMGNLDFQPAATVSQTFTITDTFSLSDFTALALLGPANTAPGQPLTLTAAINQTSAAWFPTKQTVGNGFTTHFQFQISANGTTPLADGFAFVIQNVGTGALGTTGMGGYLGYQGISNSIAFEFDTFQNGWDPNSNHIAIQSNGTAANSADHTQTTIHAVNSSLATTLSNGLPHGVTITYDGSSTLTVSLDEAPQTDTLKLTGVNLSNLLSLDPGGNAVIGFTAATGTGSELTQILSWSYSSN